MQVTWGVTYTIWLIVALPTVRFSPICLPLTPTSLLVVFASLRLVITIRMVPHLPMRNLDTPVSGMPVTIVLRFSTALIGALRPIPSEALLHSQLLPLDPGVGL